MISLSDYTNGSPAHALAYNNLGTGLKRLLQVMSAAPTASSSLSPRAR
jgi:hypothetical protein